MRRINYSKSKNQCAGAVLVEFSMVAFILFMLISAVVQFSFAFFQYNMLTDGLTSSLRSIVVNTMSTDVSTLTDEVNPLSVQYRTRENMVSKGFIGNGNDIIFSSGDLIICRQNEVCQLRVRAQWQVKCIFCIVPFEPMLNIRSSIPFEDPCFLESTSCTSAPAC